MAQHSLSSVHTTIFGDRGKETTSESCNVFCDRKSLIKHRDLKKHWWFLNMYLLLLYQHVKSCIMPEGRRLPTVFLRQINLRIVCCIIYWLEYHIFILAAGKQWKLDAGLWSDKLGAADSCVLVCLLHIVQWFRFVLSSGSEPQWKYVTDCSVVLIPQSYVARCSSALCFSASPHMGEPLIVLYVSDGSNLI